MLASLYGLCLFYRYFHGKCAISVSDLVPPIRMSERETRLSAFSHPYTLALLRCRAKSHSNSFIPCTASLWSSLPGACFPPSYNLACFKRKNQFLPSSSPNIPFFFFPFFFSAPCQEWHLFEGELTLKTALV